MSYAYLNQSGNVVIDDVDDVKEFEEMEAAMDKMNFTDEERRNIFSIVGAILHLGNIHFQSTGEKKSEIDTKEALGDAAALLEVTSVLSGVYPGCCSFAVCTLCRCLRMRCARPFASASSPSRWICPVWCSG